jgi:hypothetical protein
MKRAAAEHSRERALPYEELWKERELRFDPDLPGQVERAAALLKGLQNMEVRVGEHPCCLVVRYNLADYTLSGLIQGLTDEGFRLDDSFLCRSMRALIVFSEETELNNLQQPERLIKKSNEVYINAYQHHPHGDHDDTPPDVREYK